MKIIFTEQQINDIITMCKNGKSALEISKTFGVCSSRILKELKIYGLKTKFHRRFKLTPENEKIICDLYNDGYASTKITKLLNASKPCVLLALHKNNIEIKNKSAAHMKHKFNINFFENIDSSEKAYWLGFIMGDGCVYENKIIINLSTKDEKHLYNFKNSLKSDHNIIITKVKNTFTQKLNTMTNITISSQKMANDLRKYNIKEGKTKKSTLPTNIPYKYIASYILGLNDADGCFRKSKNKISFSLVGTKKLLLDIQKILIKECGINKTKLIKHHTTPYIFYLEYQGNLQMARIVKFLYQDLNLPFLQRKYERIKHFLT